MSVPQTLKTKPLLLLPLGPEVEPAVEGVEAELVEQVEAELVEWVEVTPRRDVFSVVCLGDGSLHLPGLAERSLMFLSVREQIKPRSTRGNLCACVIPNSAPPKQDVNST